MRNPRLHRAPALARAGRPFAAAAATCGYADQAHLARDVRALAGARLTDLVASVPGPPFDSGLPTEPPSPPVSISR